jgi:MFS family permease
VGFEISVGCLIWVLLNELFPPYVRSAANSIGVFNYLAFSTVASILFPYFHTWMGYYGTFVFYAVAALICLIVIYLYVPDARGVDLEVSYKLVDKSCKKTNSALTCEVYDDNEDSIEIRHNERSSLLDKNE